MLKNSDEKIKEILKENDDIIVPQKITEGIDKTLKDITNRRRNKMKKGAITAAIISVIAIPVVVGAYKQVQKIYVPRLGMTVETDSDIYLLEKSIRKKIGSRTVILKDIYYDKQGKTILVQVEGNGKTPENKSKLKINNWKLKSKEGNVYGADSNKIGISWDATYIFEYDKEYNGKEVKFELILDSGDKAEFTAKLKKGKQVNDVNELGIASTSKGIEITAIVEEENNKLDVTLLNNLSDQILISNYGQSPNSEIDPYGLDIDTLTLKDVNGNISKGKIDAMKDNSNNNRYTFDTTNLTKPYTINIPEIELHISTIDNKDMITSDALELPIPKNNEKIILNKTTNLETNDTLLKDSNKEVNLLSIERNDEECTIEIDYPDKIDRKEKLLRAVIIPTGESTTPGGEDWFESGLCGSYNEYGNETISFKLPYPDSDKLYIKVLGSIYKIEGDWQFVIK